MAIQGTIGFISGGLGAFARPATTAASVFGRMIIKGIIGGITSVVSQLGERGVEAIYYGKHENLVDGLATSFAIGFLAGFAGAGFGNKVGKPDASTTMPLRIFARQILSPTNRSALALLQNEGRVALAKCVGAAGLTGGGGKLAGWGTTELDLVHKGSDFYRIEIVPLLHQSGFD